MQIVAISSRLHDLDLDLDLDRAALAAVGQWRFASPQVATPCRSESA
ncbi:hypothetical protein I5U23_21140 [Stenotrophomonas maltophilia]|uniref:Uncharacterized protein n=1 Tax=Stenotrophomonas riyadhensis TaxID=2859893 RepID=A0ABT2XKP3_9GAMM|nr:hypothetical protein [Stenotrophomonas sp. CFS3442]MBH1620429.1 hypothetical protein [Stenotrophomonas maltophilia]MCV0326523.1 hypothetical protein [Stenotrophomonas sp. CFS3442]HEL4244373.1 hypothetical protein [Stenotrophomonas maltophilia]